MPSKDDDSIVNALIGSVMIELGIVPYVSVYRTMLDEDYNPYTIPPSPYRFSEDVKNSINDVPYVEARKLKRQRLDKKIPEVYINAVKKLFNMGATSPVDEVRSDHG